MLRNLVLVMSKFSYLLQQTIQLSKSNGPKIIHK